MNWCKLGIHKWKKNRPILGRCARCGRCYTTLTDGDWDG